MAMFIFLHCALIVLVNLLYFVGALNYIDFFSQPGSFLYAVKMELYFIWVE